jgi:hypothetical protein
LKRFQSLSRGFTGSAVAKCMSLNTIVCIVPRVVSDSKIDPLFISGMRHYSAVLKVEGVDSGVRLI